MVNENVIKYSTEQVEPLRKRNTAAGYIPQFIKLLLQAVTFRGISCGKMMATERAVPPPFPLRTVGLLLLITLAEAR